MIDLLKSRMEATQHDIDVYSALVLSCKHLVDPDIVAKRERLEQSLDAARAHLKRIKEQLL